MRRERIRGIIWPKEGEVMTEKKRTPAGAMALGGVLAALALVVMGLGGLIPVATYVCPVICMMVLQVVLKLCGSRVAWAWYGAVAFLSLMISPDKEAAAVFVFIGYYPVVKPRLDQKKHGWICKGLLFNGSILVLYWLLLHFLGLEALSEEFAEMNGIMVLVLLALGNLTFALLDRLLGMKPRRRRK